MSAIKIGNRKMNILAIFSIAFAGFCVGQFLFEKRYLMASAFTIMLALQAFFFYARLSLEYRRIELRLDIYAREAMGMEPRCSPPKKTS